MRHRGPDDFDLYIGSHFAGAHCRLAVMDPARGQQPMKRTIGGKEYVIVYNGEVYNANEERAQLKKKGYVFETTSDTEVVLLSYIAYGETMVEHLNGIYSFVIWNEAQRCAFFCRDRLGVKPLFYAWRDNQWIFGSEIKALLEHPKVEPEVNRYGLCELFGIGPARVPGCGVFEGIYEILPGHCGTVSEGGMCQRPYWQLQAVEVKASYEEAVEQVQALLKDSIQRQMQSDVPLCTLLSGGLDSSVVSAVAARYRQERGRQLDTYSFDFVNNDENFSASSFQPEQDRQYVEQMVAAIGSNHTYLECDVSQLYDCLFRAVDAKDLPGMTDVDASLLYFSGQIKQQHTVCLSGECADEIFGGYPWFRAAESFSQKGFPWTREFSLRKQVLNPTVRKQIPLEEYVNCQYQRSVGMTPYLEGQEADSMEPYWNMTETERQALSEQEKMRYVRRREREISYLNIQCFMATLLERKDRMTMANGLEVRVPFADHRLVGYLYQLPWEYKYHNQQVKSLLKDSFENWLPDSVVHRKKCPYPKTYDPKFEAMLKRQLELVLNTAKEPIRELVDVEALSKMLKEPSDYGAPWFGQLMARPQMYAYLLQINYWIKTYHVHIKW